MAGTGKLADKVIVVTGGSQGVGEAIAREAAALGAAGIAICGRDMKKGEATAQSIGASGTPCVFVQADLAREEDCRRVVRRADERFGRVDGLVNAAGLTNRGTIDNTTVQLWDLLFAVNARAPFILIQEAVRVMRREKRGGSIVNIITRSSHGGQPFLTAYSASKGALAVLTKNVAHALRADRIRVNGINIGWMDTPGEHVIQKSDGKPADWLERANAAQPFGRILVPRDAAVLAAYLLGDDSMLMTGSLIDFDQNVMGAYD